MDIIKNIPERHGHYIMTTRNGAIVVVCSCCNEVITNDAATLFIKDNIYYKCQNCAAIMDGKGEA